MDCVRKEVVSSVSSIVGGILYQLIWFLGESIKNSKESIQLGIPTMNGTQNSLLELNEKQYQNFINFSITAELLLIEILVQQTNLT